MTTRGGGTPFLGRGGMGRAGRVRRLKYHRMLITDHADNPALILFQAEDSRPFLPPLYSYPVYFTHDAASPVRVDTDALARTIWGGGPANFRLELHFLPGRSRDDCIAHYRREKAARGDYEPQVEAGGALPPDNEDDDEKETQSRSGGELPLPGLVPSYRNKETDMHHGLLYIIEGPTCPEDGQKVRRVLFDAITQDEWDAVMRSYGEEPGEQVQPVAETDALTVEEVGGRMSMDAHSKTENVLNEAWQKATAHNWTSW